MSWGLPLGGEFAWGRAGGGAPAGPPTLSGGPSAGGSPAGPGPARARLLPPARASDWSGWCSQRRAALGNPPRAQGGCFGAGSTARRWGWACRRNWAVLVVLVMLGLPLAAGAERGGREGVTVEKREKRWNNGG